MTSVAPLLQRRVLAVLLVGATAVGLLAGCTGETQTERATSADSTAEIKSPTIVSGDTTSPTDTVDADVPYVPTPQPVVDRMLEMAEVDENDVVYDLGSGDGRIVIRAAEEYGSRGVGIEIDPELVQEARTNAREAGVGDLVEFRQGDLFKADISGATAVTMYLLPDVNLKLRPLLFEQLRPGTPVVSHGFDMDEWEPEKTDMVDGNRIYRWTIPDQVPPHLRQK
jgi:SAM-dependent methyltransferase